MSGTGAGACRAVIIAKHTNVKLKNDKKAIEGHANLVERFN